MEGTALDLPLELRANDVTRHIINIDSRFREVPNGSTSTNFYYRLFSPVKNILRIRITSVEFPNNYPVFTAERRTVTLRIIYNIASPQTFVVTIPDGNYSAFELQAEINAILASGLPWLQTAFDLNSGFYTFTGTQYFGVDTTWNGIDRPFDYGLGYYMGFSRQLHKAVGSGTSWTVTSTQISNFAGDTYVLLKVNEFNCVRQQTIDETLSCLAKIVLRQPKNYMTFDDYASQHVKEVVFPSPQDLSRFHIQVLDAYGDPIDLISMQFSFSMEVLEVRNMSLYNTIRDAIVQRYV